MNNIDTRIVEMQFENGKFERDAANTIATLEKLDASLDFKNAATAFKDITAAANNVSLQGIENGIEWIEKRFSLMGSAIHKEFDKITEKAFAMGENLATSLTIKPITDGWGEYNTKVSATQTLLNNVSRLGEGMSDVSKALDELNTYADKTTYSYGDMVGIMGQVSTAGLNTEQSADYVQGLSNLTAYLGKSNSDMYGLSFQATEALNKGYFQYQDWLSFMHRGYNAKVFEDVLIETAREAYQGTGIDIDAVIAGAGSFAKSLQESESSLPNWLTSDIYLAAIGKFHDQTTELGKAAFKSATEAKTLQEVLDQVQESLGSGWSRTWEILIGNVEQAKEFWTPIADGITSITDGLTGDRNSLLEAVMVLERRLTRPNHILDSITGLLDNLKTILEAVGEAWKEVMPAIKPRDIVKFLAKISDFINKDLKPSEKSLGVIKGIVRGIGTFVKMIATVAQGALKIIEPLAGLVWNLIEYVATLLSDIGNFISGDGSALDSWAEGFLSICEDIGNFIKDIPENVTKMWESIKEGWENIREIVKDRTGFDINQPFVDAYNAVVDFVTYIEESVADGSLWQKVQDAVAPIGEFFTNLFGGEGEEGSDNSISTMVGNTVSNIIEKFNELKTTIENLTIDDALNGLNESLKDPVGTFKKMFLGDDENAATIVDIGDAYEKISTQLTEFGNHFTEFWSKIEPYATKLAETLKPVADALLQVVTTLGEGLVKSLEQFGKEGLSPQEIASFGAVGAFWYVAFRLKELTETLSQVPDNLNKIVNNLTSPLTKLVGVIADTIGQESKKVKADTFKAYAIGIAAIVGSVVAITYLNLEGLNAGIGAMAAIVALLGVVVSQISKLTMELDLASMTGIAIFLNQFGSALLKIAAGIALIQWSGDNINETVSALIAILSYIYLLYKAVSNISGMDPKKALNAASITAFGAVLKAFGFAVLEISAAIALLSHMYSTNGIESFSAAVGVIEILYLEMLALTEIFTKKGSNEISTFINSERLLGIGTALVEIAIAIDIIVAGIWALSTIENTNALLVAAAIVGGLIVLVGVFFAALNGIKFDSNVASTVLVISVALILMAVAIDVLIVGIGAIALLATQFTIEDALKAIMIVGVGALVLVLLAGVVGLLAEIGPEVSLGFITGSIAMIAMAVAVTIITHAMADLINAVKDVPDADINKVWAPIVMMIVIMAALAIASLIFMAGGISGAVGLIAAAGAVWIFAQALNALIPAVEKLGAMDTTQLGQGLIALCIIAVILVVVGALVVAAAPMLIVLGIAAIEFGVGILFVALAFKAFAEGLLAIGAAGTVSLPMVAAIASAFSSGLINGIVDSLISFIQRLPEIVSNLGDSFIEILDTVQTIIINYLVWNATSTVTGLIKAVNAFASVAAPLIGRLCEVLIELLTELLKGINNGLEQNKHEIAYYIGNIVAILLEILVEALYICVVKLGEWLNQVSPEMFNTLLQLGSDMVDNLIQGINDSEDWLWEQLTKFADGILSHIIPGYEQVKEAAGGIVSGISDALGGIGDAASNAVDGVGNALDGIGHSLSGGVDKTIKFFQIGSPSKLMQEDIVHDGIIAGVVKGFDLYGDDASNAMGEMATNMFSAFDNDLMNMDMSNLFGDLDPTITPVVDLSEVESSFKDISTMAGNTTFDFAALANRSFNAKALRDRQDSDDTTKRVEDLMSSLSNRDASILDALTNSSEDIKVYLDNDVLVGELYRGIDSKLGKAATIQRRQ